MKPLFEMLEDHGESDIYPYHMPGHKRNSWGMLPESMYRRDITEIDGFDNLHQPEGILCTLQEKAAALYGAEESYYLINGSTGGILSAVSAAIPSGGHILMARNCHRSAYHAAYLRNLRISYLYPQLLPEYDIADAVTPGQVQEALERETDLGAVLVVSPTYEGRIADIPTIARLVHKRGIPLIVDEAHGAHLGLAEGFAPNSCQAGADLVIHSVHKTLPALTQSALLHINGRFVDRNRVRRFLHIYQSSSPSYLLMAGIDNALRGVEREGREKFAEFLLFFQQMRSRLDRCRHLKFLPWEPARQDVGKLLISVKGTGWTGPQLYHTLLERYQLQMEMAAESLVLAMFTVNDRPEGYMRLAEALLEIDKRMDRTDTGNQGSTDSVAMQAVPGGMTPGGGEGLSLAKAWDMEKCQMKLEDSVGRYAAEFVNLYPPGVPVLVPGEIITRRLCDQIAGWVEMGLKVQGIVAGERDKYICVVA